MSVKITFRWMARTAAVAHLYSVVDDRLVADGGMCPAAFSARDLIDAGRTPHCPACERTERIVKYFSPSNGRVSVPQKPQTEPEA